jgi:hypothetical protein
MMGLLFNFGPSAPRRYVFDNEKKYPRHLSEPAAKKCLGSSR